MLKLMVCVLALLLISPLPARAEQLPTRDPFLNNLVGCWRLTGSMGATVLRQRVEARWVVGDQFLEMRFRQSDEPTPDTRRYEAIYLIGYDPQARRYVLNLFDTFGVGASQTAGLGVRQGDSVPFYFPYSQGDFLNTFSWSPEQTEWRMHLQRRDESGAWVNFATKTMRRC